MYCPQCGQERLSEVTRFCSRCGYLLTGTAELMKTGGESPDKTEASARSPRSRGIRQGVFMILLMLVLAPLVGIILQFAVGNTPWPVGVVVMLFGGGGLLRIVYALLFQSNDTKRVVEHQAPRETATNRNFSTAQLPPQRETPASDYVAAQPSPDAVTRTPGSVTEGTTRLLEKDEG